MTVIDQAIGGMKLMLDFYPDDRTPYELMNIMTVQAAQVFSIRDHISTYQDDFFPSVDEVIKLIDDLNLLLEIVPQHQPPAQIKRVLEHIPIRE